MPRQSGIQLGTGVELQGWKLEADEAVGRVPLSLPVNAKHWLGGDARKHRQAVTCAADQLVDHGLLRRQYGGQNGG